MEIKFAIDGVTIDNKSQTATVDRMTAYSLVNQLVFALACTDNANSMTVVEEDTMKPKSNDKRDQVLPLRG